MNPLEVGQKRAELVAIASGMLNGEIHLIEGARRICSIRFELKDPDNEAFLPMVAIDSETDHLPLGPMRERYAEGALQRADEELNQYIAKAKPDILEACRRILQAFAN